jgi:hypothetical protein
MIKTLKIILLVGIALLLLSFDYTKNKEPFTYGVSFSRFHTDELKLDWKETYLAILNDLGVRHFRFSAHWPIVEPEQGKYNFTELDFQIKEAEKVGADVILAVGRRLPGWPECHVPDWANKLEPLHQEQRVLNIITQTVTRYKDSPAIKYWQVENEPYLAFFAKHVCGNTNEDLLQKEIDLVKQLDPTRKVLVTDSGEFGTWYNAYRKGEVFGTSMYLYIWNRKIGPVRYPITPAFFRIKQNIINIFFGKKESFVIELSAEPWLLQPIIDTPLDTQLDRMGIDKFNKMINFSSKSGFDTFYLWGAEWWYWLKKNNHPDHWDRAKQLFSQTGQ